MIRYQKSILKKRTLVYISVAMKNYMLGILTIGFSCVVLEAKILLNILERSLENYGRRNLTIMNCNHLDYQTVLYPYELYGVINICL